MLTDQALSFFRQISTVLLNSEVEVDYQDLHSATVIAMDGVTILI